MDTGTVYFKVTHRWRTSFYWVKLLATQAMLLIGTGCSVQYADPYYGYLDETKSFKTEGFIATMNQGGPFVQHPKRPDRWKDFPPYTSRHCADNEANQPRLLRQLKQSIQDQLPHLKTSWTQSDTRLHIEIPQISVFFVGAPHLRPDAYKTLDTLIELLLQEDQLFIHFIGHADASGPENFNLVLSTQRALHLQRYFVLHGYPQELTLSRGVGESQPLASNAEPSGRQLNRRVSLSICTV